MVKFTMEIVQPANTERQRQDTNINVIDLFETYH